MAAQLATEALGVEQVVAKINDPVRAEAYAELGIATLCRTGLMLDAIDRFLGLPPTACPGCSPRPVTTTARRTRTRRRLAHATGEPARHRPTGPTTVSRPARPPDQEA